MFGLDSALTLIREAEQSTSYSRDNYGVPLSAAEEAELQRRVQVEWDTHDAAAFGRKQAGWGGHYFDQLAGGAPVFMFTSNLDLMRAEIEQRLPTGTAFRVEQVDEPLERLLSLQETIVAEYADLRRSGIHVTSTGVDLLSNTVVVGVDQLTESDASLILGRFGADVRVVSRAPARSDACPATNCRPIKGGIKVSGPEGPCTAGFVVRRVLHGARLSILTAGHCIWIQDPNTGGLNINWYHVSNGVNNVFGNGKYHTFFDMSNGDVGLIEIDDNEAPSQANKLYINNGSSGAVYTVTNYIFDDDQTVGSQACAYGYASNNSDCTAITMFDETMESCVPLSQGEVCHDIQHTKVYGYNLVPGDSGGPIYQVASSTTRYMMGTHVHSEEGNANPVPGDGWYTPYGYGRIAYVAHAASGDNYSLCITASC